MSFVEIFKVISSVTISVGGAGFIFWKLSTYIGKIWAVKYLESIKKEYQKEIENYKLELDILKETSLRYSNRQFELYNDLWHSLYSLKLSADILWEKANMKNLKEFSRQLETTINEIEKSYLFIEEEHYQKLMSLLKQFGEYEFGKTKLIELYRQDSEVYSQDVQDINCLIECNKEKKEKYKQIINEIRADLKKQIKGIR
ncbi:hypothetical protein COS16_07755 [Candidatus Desantisbacteria bacterium CG02_land_8_20_14_3_00_49_13]|nr:MAG: hypothetical protein AUJ67_00690 [Candidatus Desantisbacteria bacterium CG1_02_49_89]PIV55291.1 MAG: hypothetical protein COS16_07755 [Candidatus Desantisbacteria bacterium CG02_land_8_20_14_3_00_49_13]